MSTEVKPQKKGEEPHYAHVGCLSLPTHITATMYDELTAHCKRLGYYWAVKAEDTNCITEMGWDKPFEELDGKVHIHFLYIQEKAEHAHPRGDLRYGAKKNSHCKEYLLRDCPSIASAIIKSQFSKKFALMIQAMTSDQAVVYYSKESLLRNHNLPADMAVLRDYFTAKSKVRQYNPEDDAHVQAYKKEGYPVPATMQSVWDYLTSRWYVNNNCKRVKMEQQQVAAAKNLYHAINGEAPELPKALRGFDNGTAPKRPAQECTCTFRLLKVDENRQQLYTKNLDCPLHNTSR